jgi:hypothetical protein
MSTARAPLAGNEFNDFRNQILVPKFIRFNPTTTKAAKPATLEPFVTNPG